MADKASPSSGWCRGFSAYWDWPCARSLFPSGAQEGKDSSKGLFVLLFTLGTCAAAADAHQPLLFIDFVLDDKGHAHVLSLTPSAPHPRPPTSPSPLNPCWPQRISNAGLEWQLLCWYWHGPLRITFVSPPWECPLGRLCALLVSGDACGPPVLSTQGARTTCPSEWRPYHCPYQFHWQSSQHLPMVAWGMSPEMPGCLAKSTIRERPNPLCFSNPTQPIMFFQPKGKGGERLVGAA